MIREIVEWADPMQCFDGGIDFDINPEYLYVLRIEDKNIYYLDHNGIVCVTTGFRPFAGETVAIADFSPDCNALDGGGTGIYITFPRKLRESGAKLVNVRDTFRGFKMTVDGERAEYNNATIFRRILSKLVPGDHYEKMTDLAKETSLPSKARIYKRIIEEEIRGFDGGIEYNAGPGTLSIIRYSKGVLYFIDQDGIVRTTRYFDVFRRKNVVLPSLVSVLGRHWDLERKLTEHGAKVDHGGSVFSTYRIISRGRREPYRNESFLLSLICELKPGDHYSRLNELAKQRNFGDKTLNIAAQAMSEAKKDGFTEEFFRETTTSISVDTREEPIPYFHVDIGVTSRVNMDFVRAHRKEFMMRAMERAERTTLFKKLGLTRGAYRAEMINLTRHGKVQVVIGLKQEIIDALQDVEISNKAVRYENIRRIAEDIKRKKQEDNQDNK